MTITKIELERFTAFEKLTFEASPGINVLVGANGTGKTHLMKVAYAACDISKTGSAFTGKLIRVFLPSGRAPGRLVKRRKKSSRCSVKVHRQNQRLAVSFSNHAKEQSSARVSGRRKWIENPIDSVYIPVKEMLANAPGFRSLYAQREVHFEEIYDDILSRAYLPKKLGPRDANRKKLLAIIQGAINGKVEMNNEEFFFTSKQGKLEFTLLAEGTRKLGLLWLLIQNGTLPKGSVLFWDEPETNLNPKLFRPLIEILLTLEQMGVQIFLATHDYAILKELDLQRKRKSKITFHSLYRNPEGGEVECHRSESYLEIHPNAIAEAFADLYDREVERSLKGLRK